MEENEKQIKINVPTGYVIDRENSTFECIKFKKKESRFANYDKSYDMTGYFIDRDSKILQIDKCDEFNCPENKNVFVSRGAAISALALAQITQIREHEHKRYGHKPSHDIGEVYAIFYDTDNNIEIFSRNTACSRLEAHLAFDTKEQAELFLKENTQLIKEYFMMD